MSDFTVIHDRGDGLRMTERDWKKAPKNARYAVVNGNQVTFSSNLTHRSDECLKVVMCGFVSTVPNKFRPPFPEGFHMRPGENDE